MTGSGPASAPAPAEMPPRDPAPSQPFRARQLLGALLVYAMLAIALTAKVWTDPANSWIGGCCDQEQAIWSLAWTPSAVAHGQDPLLTDRLNAPAGANLMWNLSNPIVGLVVAPVTLTGGPILAYNVAVVGLIALSGLAAFVALLRYTRRPLGPLVGGGLYALSPYVASHSALHLNLVSAWAPPLFLILFDEVAFRRQRTPAVLGVLIGLVATLQLLTSEEILATSAVAGAVLALVLVLVVRDRRAILPAARRVVGAAISAFVTFLVLGGLPLAVQFLGPQQIHGSVTNAALYSTDALNLIVPTPYQLLAPAAVTSVSSQFSGLYHEATAYVGLPLLLVLGCVVARQRQDRVVVAAATVAIVMFVLSLGPHLIVGNQATSIPMPWLLLGSLPLLEHAVPGRLTLLMWLAIAVLVARAIDAAAVPDSLLRRNTRVPVPAAIGRLGAIAVALVFVLPSPHTSTQASIPEFFRSWNQQGVADDQTILVAPWFYDGAGADPMLWAAVAGAAPRYYEGYVYVPGPDGRPQFGPTGGQLSSIMTAIQDHGEAVVARGAVRGAALRQLAGAQISVVIVGPMAARSQMVQFFSDLLGEPPVEQAGVELWRNVSQLVSRQLAATG